MPPCATSSPCVRSWARTSVWWPEIPLASLGNPSLPAVTCMLRTAGFCWVLLTQKQVWRWTWAKTKWQREDWKREAIFFDSIKNAVKYCFAARISPRKADLVKTGCCERQVKSKIFLYCYHKMLFGNSVYQPIYLPKPLHFPDQTFKSEEKFTYSTG